MYSIYIYILKEWIPFVHISISDLSYIYNNLHDLYYLLSIDGKPFFELSLSRLSVIFFLNKHHTDTYGDTESTKKSH